MRSDRPRSSSRWMTSSSDFWPKLVIAKQVVVRPLHEFADGVHLGPLEAVAGTLGQVEVLDGKVEVR